MANKILEYIGKQKTPQKEICQRLPDLILDRFPGIKEEMKWGVPTFADGAVYIVALKDHVNLGFSVKGLSNEEIALFDGGGKTMNVVTIATLREIDEARIVKLLELVSGKDKAGTNHDPSPRRRPVDVHALSPGFAGLFRQ